ncbi:hypothetical protein L9F63_024942, partial [Diploptera punctata]
PIGVITQSELQRLSQYASILPCHTSYHTIFPGPSSKGGAAGGKGKAQVKPFTKESLDRMESKTVQLVKDYGFQPRRKLSVEDGSVLPGKFEPFPSKLYGRPLEEIDNFIYDE